MCIKGGVWNIKWYLVVKWEIRTKLITLASSSATVAVRNTNTTSQKFTSFEMSILE